MKNQTSYFFSTAQIPYREKSYIKAQRCMGMKDLTSRSGGRFQRAWLKIEFRLIVRNPT
jgi:hypothetical protein